jgi:hypothetical protein
MATMTLRLKIYLAWGALSLFLSMIAASGANKYIRADAAGTGGGTNWTDAYTAVPASLTRGDVYYVADGSYSGSDISESGTGLITFKKATVADHGTATGWDNTYGDGQTVFTSGFSITESSHYLFDGYTTSTNYGFRVNVLGTSGGATSTQAFYGRNDSATPMTNFTFRYVEMVCAFGENVINPMWGEGSGRGIYFHPTGRWYDGISISHCSIRGCVDSIYIKYCHNLLVEYTEMSWGSSGYIPNHPNILWGGVIHDCVWRYNIMHDHGAVGIGLTEQGNNWQVYGNVAWAGAFTNNTGTTFVTMYDNAPANYSNHIWFNNTIDGLQNPFYISGSARRDIFVKNNLLWDCYSTYAGDYGLRLESSDPDPFVNRTAFDYHIVATTGTNYPRNIGYSAGTTNDAWSYDSDGVLRGNDGAWDVGAFEYAASSSNPPVIISSLTWSGTNGTPITPYSIATSNTATSWGANPLPTGLTLSGSTISGTPSATGTTNTTITATNAYGGDSETLVWTIADPAGAFSVIQSELDFGYVATNCTSDLYFTVTNYGGGVLDGYATNAAATFSFPGNVVYSLAAHTSTNITVRYSPTAVGTNSGTVSWSHGGTNTVIGYAYPVAAATSWTLTSSLLRGTMTSNVNNYISTPVNNFDPVVKDNAAVFGFRAASSGTVKLRTISIATNGSSDSFYVVVNNQSFVETTNAWQVIPWTTNWAVSYVHQWGNGTYNNPEFYTNAFAVNAGVNYVVVGAREANAKLREMEAVFTPNVSAGAVWNIQNLNVR